MSSPTLRGLLVGGIVGLVLHLIMRFVLGNLVWIALAVMLLWVIAKCSPENPKEVSKRARLNSFDPSAILVLNARGTTPSYSTYVEAVSATVQNTSNARIYDLRLYCSFKPLPPRSSSEAEASRDIDRVYTSYHYGYINHGTTVTIRLIPEPNGYLKEANPESFNCEARFEVERADLLNERP
ncbi:hypothetical protein JKG68_07435 [Microvirga aerilata]|uniref:Uncharacterized protein n=1 Tax=Microvirga aerilata TaxID=670292 RepID=A0A936Z6J4_9HYPH|nr:hypothetical protein [Microvirga aerilata]MBL0403791.1 hypothetical protein [Microvirga aerilata]